MKNTRHKIITGIVVALLIMLQPIIVGAVDKQVARGTALAQAQQIKKKTKDARKSFEDMTQCGVYLVAILNGEEIADSSDIGILEYLLSCLKENAARAATFKSAISIQVIWTGTVTYTDSIIVKTDKVDTSLFSPESLKAFRDTIEHYRESLTSVADSKLSDRIIVALSMLREQKEAIFPCTKCGHELKMTHQTLMDVFPNSTIISDNPITAEYFQTAFEKAPLNTCYRIAHLLAQVHYESGGMKAQREDLDYTLERLLLKFNTTSAAKMFFKQSFWDNKEYLQYAVIGIYEEVDTTKGKGDYAATAYETFRYNGSKTDTIRIPISFKLSKGKGLYKKNNLTEGTKQSNRERWVNQVYGRGSLGNGSPQTGDGYKYRGRGAIQLTGKDNYDRVGKKCNKLFGTSYNWVANPDSVATDTKANIYSAISYILVKFSDLSVMDTNDVGVVTEKINSKKDGLDKRKQKFDILTTNQYKCTTK
jgi:predicted chitinase